MDISSPGKARSYSSPSRLRTYSSPVRVPSAASTPKIPKRRLPFDQHEQYVQEENELQAGDEYKQKSSPETSETLVEDSSKDSAKQQSCCTPKIQTSFVLCFGFLCFGASMAIIGPTVLELGCLIGSDVGAMSWVFFAQTSSALIGAICSGIIIDRFAINYNVYLAFVMTVHALSLSVLPFMRDLGALITMTSMHGLFGGFQDTATNLRMIIMHGQEVPPYLQTLFFFYGIGAFLSPIAAGNFLNDECNKGDPNSLNEFAFARRKRHNGIGNNHLWKNTYNTKDIRFADKEGDSGEHEIIRISSTKVHFAYWIVSLLHILVVVTLLYLYVLDRRRKEKQAALDQSDQSTQDSDKGSKSASMTSSGDDLNDSMSSIRSEIDPEIKTQVVLITMWISMMVFISDGLQGAFGSYIYTYAVKSGIGIDADDAAYLNSLFWGSLALGRLLAIFVSIYVSPRIMLLFDIGGCLTSIIVMFILRHKIISLWIGTATFGLCLSNIFPTSVSMAESYFRLTGTITCIFVVCSGTGEMTVPLIIGKLFDVIGPISFLGISCILCFTAVGIYIAVILTGRGLARKQAELGSRTMSVESIRETEALLTEAEEKATQGHLEIRLSSDATSEANGNNSEPSEKDNGDKDPGSNSNENNTKKDS